MPGLPIQNKCNNCCLMCSNSEAFSKKKQDFSLSTLVDKIKRFRLGEDVFLENFRDAFYIGGGEPTLSPHLVPIIKEIGSLFPESKIICLTNGRRFVYERFTEEILSSHNNLELAISVHGHNAKIHDKITRVQGSFSETIRGLRNILRYKKTGQIVEIRIVIHGLNYRFLEQITHFLRKEFPSLDRVVYMFFEIEGRACKNISGLRLTYSELFPYMARLYNLIDYFSEVRFYHFPLCTIEPRFYPYVWRTLPDYETTFIKICKKCRLREYCLGLHKGYLKYVGTDGLRSITPIASIKKSNNWHNPIQKVSLKLAR